MPTSRHPLLSGAALGFGALALGSGLAACSPSAPSTTPTPAEDQTSLGYQQRFAMNTLAQIAQQAGACSVPRIRPSTERRTACPSPPSS